MDDESRYEMHREGSFFFSWRGNSWMLLLGWIDWLTLFEREQDRSGSKSMLWWLARIVRQRRYLMLWVRWHASSSGMVEELTLSGWVTGHCVTSYYELGPQLLTITGLVFFPRASCISPPPCSSAMALQVSWESIWSHRRPCIIPCRSPKLLSSGPCTAAARPPKREWNSSPLRSRRLLCGRGFHSTLFLCWHRCPSFVGSAMEILKLSFSVRERMALVSLPFHSIIIISTDCEYCIPSSLEAWFATGGKA